MMTKRVFTSLAIIFITISLAQAQELKISQFDFATSIEDRQPVDVDTSFAADIGNVFCFTHVKGATDTTQIAHVWYYKDEEKARINLDVTSDDWRTWSSKSIPQNWTGRWRVMIENSDGTVLTSKTFVIK